MRTFKAMHKYYNDCYTNGVFDPDKILSKNLVDEYEKEFRLSTIKVFFESVINCKFMNNLAKDYITNGNKGYEDIINIYNSNKEDCDKLDINTGKGRITACQRKVAESFPTVEYNFKEICILDWLLGNEYHRGIESNDDKIAIRIKFINQINRFRDIYYNESSYDYKKRLLIQIPFFERVKELSDEDFNNFMDIIKPYSKVNMELVQKELNNMSNEVGYFRFLMGKNSNLTSTDIERKSVILRCLGLENNDSDKLKLYHGTLDADNNTLDTDNSNIGDDVDF